MGVVETELADGDDEIVNPTVKAEVTDLVSFTIPFLVKMRQELRDKNLPESTELPDHLTHVLALLGRLTGEEADELVARYLLPGMDKMLAGMRKKGSSYEAVLETVMKVARKDHDVESVAPRERRGDPPGFKSQLPVFGTRGCSGVEGRKS